MFEALIPKLKLAAEQFDMIPQPHIAHFEPQPWEKEDSILPDGTQPYFLKNGSGPKYLAGSTLCRPLITTTQTAGRFTIGSIEGSSYHENHLQIMEFADVHHCFQVSDGSMHFEVDGARVQLATGETLFIPSGSKFGFSYADRFAKAYVFSNGGGLVEVLSKVGGSYDAPLIPQHLPCCKRIKLVDAQQEFGFTLH